jgi:endoglucanase
MSGWNPFRVEVTVDNGTACVEVPEGTFHRWDAQFSQYSISLTEGRRYRVETEMSAEPGIDVYVALERIADYSEVWGATIGADTTKGLSWFEFTAPADVDDMALVLNFGGGPSATACLDRVSLLELP